MSASRRRRWPSWNRLSSASQPTRRPIGARAPWPRWRRGAGTPRRSSSANGRSFVAGHKCQILPRRQAFPVAEHGDRVGAGGTGYGQAAWCVEAVERAHDISGNERAPAPTGSTTTTLRAGSSCTPLSVTENAPFGPHVYDDRSLTALSQTPGTLEEVIGGDDGEFLLPCEHEVGPRSHGTEVACSLLGGHSAER